MPRKVYVPNRSFHDFTDAARFGELVFLTDGLVNRLNVNQLTRRCMDAMADAKEDDFVLVSSLSIINAVASSIMAFAFGKVNFLIWEDDHYVERNIVLGDLPQPD